MGRGMSWHRDTYRAIRIHLPQPRVGRALLGVLLLEHDKAWITRHRDFDLTSSWQWRASHERELTPYRLKQSIHPILTTWSNLQA